MQFLILFHVFVCERAFMNKFEEEHLMLRWQECLKTAWIDFVLD